MQTYLERIFLMPFSPQELFSKLQADDVFREWKKRHPKSYLSHFFCSLDQNFILLSPWDLGMYNPEDSKITVFTHLESGFEIKPADDVFKREKAQVEELDLSKVKVTFEQVEQLFRENQEKLFPKETFGNGFLILQNFESRLMWNLTFITKSMKFANLKVSAV